MEKPTKQQRKKWNKNYRESHKKKLNEYDKQWRLENKELSKTIIAKSRLKNPEKYKEMDRKKVNKFRMNNPQIILAQRLAQSISLKDSCEICGDNQNLQRHHWRYDKPLMVNTLCQFCHNVQHGRGVLIS